MKIKFLATACVSGTLALNAAAWDYEGHQAVNALALASLPANFPVALTPETRTRIAFLAGEADRWRNETSLKAGTGLALGQASGPDHYLDLEDIYLYGLTPETLPPLRYDFVADIVKARAAHPEKYPAIDPAKDSGHTRELSGFLPWAITENYEKLQSGFATLAALEKHGGTPGEISNARQNIVYVMGVMGHFVGDASQPLHVTKHFNGWVGDNPNNYNSGHTIHAWIDGGFLRRTGGIDVEKMSAKIFPAEIIPAASGPNGIFQASMNFVVANNQLVEALYKLDKAGKLSDQGNAGAEGRAFLEAQLLKSGRLLGKLWLTAWLTAPEDTFLQRELKQRAAAEKAGAESK